MVEGPCKITRIVSVVANGVTATNILSVKDEFLMNMVPQFVPNTYRGLSMLEKSKWRVVTVVIDSESTLFDASFSVEAANTAIGTSFIINLIVDTTVDTGVPLIWTYDEAACYVQKREYGRIEDGAPRNTIEYTIVTNGERVESL